MSAPRVHETPDGATLTVRVSPGARHTRILGVLGEALKVAVQAPPEKGKANDAVEDLLAAALAVRPADVEVVRGRTARQKTVRVRGLGAAALRERLESILGTLGAP